MLSYHIITILRIIPSQRKLLLPYITSEWDYRRRGGGSRVSTRPASKPGIQKEESHNHGTVLHVLHHMSINSALEPLVITSVLLSRRRLEPMGTRTLARGFSLCKCILHRLVLSWEEDDLGVCRLGHGLHSLEVADLHSRGGRKDVSLCQR